MVLELPDYFFQIMLKIVSFSLGCFSKEKRKASSNYTFIVDKAWYLSYLSNIVALIKLN